MPEPGRVLVVGSLNLDRTMRVPHLPAPGETLAAARTRETPGGKGLNQAVAAQRAGGRVRLAGAVGLDAAGGTVLGALEGEGVDVSGVRRIDGETGTGTATILVDDEGENVIVLVAGANGAAHDTAALLGDAGSGDLVVLQGEIPAAANRAVAAEARRRGARVLWNAAPAPLESAGVVDADLVVVNEGELGALTALLGERPAAAALAARLGATVVVTLGAEGALAAGAQGEVRVPSPRVEVADTTGAGDAFVGVLSAALQGGEPLAKAMSRAAVAGALAVTRAGAWGSAPTEAEIERLLHR